MKVHYDKDEDILMIVLSNKKIDDSYETKEGNIVSVAQDREPVMIDIFRASKFLKDLGKAIPRKVQKELWSSQSSIVVAHRIRR
ncbi:hypothetical protein A2617_00525 [Candidatus Daviesbacteria bacterium RIFOXYD1_FULL_41_10]|uniref:DUF2283 domain-containing protein n=2 Tax=Candidatus Daviesiibacteriota TaxID=1752718 RepID=A0A1F5N032_9BACT|nr:MAG: hypothetical protein UU67_C0007G0003 [Candidatus Daviesbacteria bacterium GW2011_GWB1_41_5]OGE71019.1 MAG: hypothetical protein A2617_00525 [Candidatus Daviesbacteria bacterium RIFOXYD1_FULL_41_10]